MPQILPQIHTQNISIKWLPESIAIVCVHNVVQRRTGRYKTWCTKMESLTRLQNGWHRTDAWGTCNNYKTDERRGSSEHWGSNVIIESNTSSPIRSLRKISLFSLPLHAAIPIWLYCSLSCSRSSLRLQRRPSTICILPLFLCARSQRNSLALYCNFVPSW